MTQCQREFRFMLMTITGIALVAASIIQLFA
jgi:hypothetical protein